MGGEERSLFDVGNRRSGFMVVEGDRCLMLRNRRSGFVGGKKGDRCLMLRFRRSFI